MTELFVTRKQRPSGRIERCIRAGWDRDRPNRGGKQRARQTKVPDRDLHRQKTRTKRKRTNSNTTETLNA